MTTVTMKTIPNKIIPEMEIMDVLDDGRPGVLGLVAAWESSVGAFPDESDYADQ